jgi:hypothetical protein
LRLEQTDDSAAAGHERKTQLREIVLPSADGANLVKTGLVIEDQMTAAGTGKLGLVVHRLLGKRLGAENAGQLNDRTNTPLRSPSSTAVKEMTITCVVSLRPHLGDRQEMAC